jgi:pyruvate dehydrogenase E1 component
MASSSGPEDIFDLYRVSDPGLLSEWRLSLSSLEGHEELSAALLADQFRYAASLGLISADDLPINDVSPSLQPDYPGSLDVEHQIEAVTRFNAMAIVQRANVESPGLGGHLSTFASSATAVSVLLNHVANGPQNTLGPDRVFFQGHASPGVYARANLEGRLDTERLDLFRRELTGSPGLSSYPHPLLMPGFWEFPTVSMGLGPLCAIHQAMIDRHLYDRGLLEHLPRTFCFIGDGECDEPETLGAISVAAREGLSNLVFIIVCNLQRLDGPVRGGSSIVRELSGIFRGANWNVVRALWGSRWDPVFASSHGYKVASRLSLIPDGEMQRLASLADPVEIKERVFGDIDISEFGFSLDDMTLLLGNRAGSDPVKVFAALDSALQSAKPSVVLLLCEKGALLPSVASKMSAHQVKSLSVDSISKMASSLGLSVSPQEKPDYVSLDDKASSYLQSLVQKRGGSLPSRSLTPKPLSPLVSDVFVEFDTAPSKEVSTTTAHTRLLRGLLKDPSLGPSVVPIVADEGRTFGFESLYAEFGVHLPPSGVGSYRAADADMALRYNEQRNGRFLQAGISEASAMALFNAAGQMGYRGPSLFPIFEFYSMFGFQRVADLIWAAQDAGCSGVLVGATAGRTTLHGEGLQHQDGHSLLWANALPNLEVFDPAFPFEMADFYNMMLSRAATGQQSLGYLTVYNENFTPPSRPSHASLDEVTSGIYVFERDLLSSSNRVALCFSGVGYLAAKTARGLLNDVSIAADLVSVPSPKRVVESVRNYDRLQRLGHNPETPKVVDILSKYRSSVFVSDWVSALMSPVSRHVPQLTILGTDGVGRSSLRSELRSFFETDGPSVALAALGSLGFSPGEIHSMAASWGANTGPADPYRQ